MRVLYCTAPSTALKGECGGIVKEMRLREESLRALGHEVDYLSLWEPPDWQRYDLCHLFGGNGNTLSIGAALKPYLPLVLSPIIDRVSSNPLLRLGTWLDRYVPAVFTHIGRCAELCRMADMVCLRSREEKNRLLHGLGVTGACAIAPCPIEMESAEPDKGRFPEYADTPFIMFLGDAGNPRKNVERLVKAVKGLDIDLLIAGTVSDGKTGDHVRALTQSTSNVRLIGVVSEGEKTFLLQHACVFVLPSLMEGIGLSAVEAALVGTTVVITKNGGPPDYFGDKAYYVDPYSVGDIRHNIQQAKDHPLDASEWIHQHVSLENTGKELEGCYTQCLHAARETGRFGR